MRATVFAPGSIGNVGPGFDVLGLAVDGIGDRVTVELTEEAARVAAVTGRDAGLVPREPLQNVASIAAAAWLRGAGVEKRAVVSIEKGLPLAGGLGGSAASSVGGALAAALAAGGGSVESVMAAALEGEAAVAGRHLDNIAATALGGLALCRSTEPIDAVRVPVPEEWAVVILTPRVRIETKQARAILPHLWEREKWVQQMANASAVVYAFASGDAALLRRALDDLYAEPLRAPLIPRFHEVKRAALDAGALGCSISGGGPSIFAVTVGIDPGCADAMKRAMHEVDCEVHVGPIARRGAHAV